MTYSERGKKEGWKDAHFFLCKNCNRGTTGARRVLYTYVSSTLADQEQNIIMVFSYSLLDEASLYACIVSNGGISRNDHAWQLDWWQFGVSAAAHFECCCTRGVGGPILRPTLPGHHYTIRPWKLLGKTHNSDYIIFEYSVVMKWCMCTYNIKKHLLNTFVSCLVRHSMERKTHSTVDWVTKELRSVVRMRWKHGVNM